MLALQEPPRKFTSNNLKDSSSYIKLNLTLLFREVREEEKMQVNPPSLLEFKDNVQKENATISRPTVWSKMLFWVQGLVKAASHHFQSCFMTEAKLNCIFVADACFRCTKTAMTAAVMGEDTADTTCSTVSLCLCLSVSNTSKTHQLDTRHEDGLQTADLYRIYSNTSGTFSIKSWGA